MRRFCQSAGVFTFLPLFRVMMSGISVRVGSLSTLGMAGSGDGRTGSGISLGSGRGEIFFAGSGSGAWALRMVAKAARARNFMGVRIFTAVFFREASDFFGASGQTN